MRRIFYRLASRKLALWLLAVITLTSAVGISFQGSESLWQNRPAGPILLSNYVRIQDVFHSWWYIALLSMLALNLTVCSILRLKTIKTKLSPETMPQWEMVCPGTPTVWETKLVQVFGRPRYIKQEDEAFSLIWQRNSFATWSSLVFHFSMVLILLGAAINGLGGYQGYVLLSQSAAEKLSPELVTGVNKGIFTKLDPGDGEVELQQFQPLFYDGLRASQYTAQLTFRDTQGEESQAIAVNRNARFHGLVWRYYKYGYAPRVAMTYQGTQVLRSFLNLNSLDYGAASRAVARHLDTFQLQENLGLQAEFFTDLPDSKSISVSNQPRNPALKLDIGKFGNVGQAVQIERSTSLLLRPGETKQAGDWQISFLDWRYWVMFEVSYYPGEWVLNLGLVLCTLGILVRFLFWRQVVVAKVQPAAGGTRLMLWARADVSNLLFQEKIKRKLVEGGVTSAVS